MDDIYYSSTALNAPSSSFQRQDEGGKLQLFSTNRVDQPIFVDEIFGPTLEGEGPYLGEPTIYVRTGRCDYNCSWCDSKHAVDQRQYQSEWRSMHPEAIFQEMHALAGGKPILMTISGGNPAIYASVGTLIALLHRAGHRIKVETQGSIVQEWFADIDVLSLSPKPPSSEMPPLPKHKNEQKARQIEETVWTRLSVCINKARGAEIYLKIPILGEEDYAFAKAVAERYPQIPLYLQPTNPHPYEQDVQKVRDDLLERWAWLSERVLAEQWYHARVRPQAHVLLWGNKRGV